MLQESESDEQTETRDTQIGEMALPKPTLSYHLTPALSVLLCGRVLKHMPLLQSYDSLWRSLLLNDFKPCLTFGFRPHFSVTAEILNKPRIRRPPKALSPSPGTSPTKCPS